LILIDKIYVHQIVFCIFHGSNYCTTSLHS
jgi:hypothetical protein